MKILRTTKNITKEIQNLNILFFKAKCPIFKSLKKLFIYKCFVYMQYIHYSSASDRGLLFESSRVIVSFVVPCN